MREKGIKEVVQDQARSQDKSAEVGRVTKVYDKEDDVIETGNIEVNALIAGESHEYRRIPFTGFDHPGHTYCPRLGDFITVEFPTGAGGKPIATSVVHNESDRAPNARAGHWRHEFESEDSPNLYVEAEAADSEAGEQDLVRFSLKESGLDKTLAEIRLDKNGNVVLQRGDGENGLSLDADTGGFTLLDDAGYGVESDGSGNFKWYHEDVDFISAESTSLPTGME